jgi:hypothetical protein
MNFVEYYQNQCGSGLPVFYGAKYQRGSGLGNIFKSFYRWIVPVLKTHALPVLKEGAHVVSTEALKTFKNIANDALDGENIKESFKKRTKEAAHSLVEKADSIFQSGEGYKKQKRKRTKRKRKLVKRKLVKRKLVKKYKKSKKRKQAKRKSRKRRISSHPKPKRKRTKQDILD